jgi:hypothetical protein
MKTIIEYLSTKVKVEKPKDVDPENPQCIEDVIRASFIVILSQKVYKENNTFKKTIFRSKIPYDSIKDTLKDLFKYNVKDDDILGKQGAIKTTVKKYIKDIEHLINYYKVAKPGNSHEYLNGKEFFNEYKDIIMKKK